MSKTHFQVLYEDLFAHHTSIIPDVLTQPGLESDNLSFPQMRFDLNYSK